MKWSPTMTTNFCIWNVSCFALFFSKYRLICKNSSVSIFKTSAKLSKTKICHIILWKINQNIMNKVENTAFALSKCNWHQYLPSQVPISSVCVQKLSFCNTRFEFMINLKTFHSLFCYFVCPMVGLNWRTSDW